MIGERTRVASGRGTNIFYGVLGLMTCKGGWEKIIKKERSENMANIETWKNDVLIEALENEIKRLFFLYKENERKIKSWEKIRESILKTYGKTRLYRDIKEVIKEYKIRENILLVKSNFLVEELEKIKGVLQ